MKPVFALSITLFCLTLSVAEAAPYEREVDAAAKRWSLNPHDLRALIEVVSDFKNLDEPDAKGVGRFSGIAADEVARLAKINKYKRVLSEEAGLYESLSTFDLVKARVPRLGIEATALYYRHLTGFYDGDQAAALAHYRAGGLRGGAVSRRGAGSAFRNGLIDASTKRFIDAVLDMRRRLDEASPLSPPPVVNQPRRRTNPHPEPVMGPPEAVTPPPPLPPSDTTPGTNSQIWNTPATPRRGRTHFVQQDPRKYDELVKRASARHGLDPNLMRGLIQTESHFDPGARSATGAAGLGQFTGIAIKEIQRLARMPKYARAFENDPQLLADLKAFTRTGAYTPRLAVEASALYLKYLHDRYRNNTEAALTAYNAGHNMAMHVLRHGSHRAANRAGVLTFSQSSSYAPTVLRYKRQFESGRWPGVPASAGALGALRGAGGG